MAPSSLRIGCVQYLNARPLIHGWPGKVIFDHPSTLCARLAAGELDVALVSSFEFLRNPIYSVVDAVSISSDGPVYSVFVAYADESPLPNIELDPASQTSVALLRSLIAEHGHSFTEAEIAEDRLSPLRSGYARLLIGDQALRFRQKFADAYRYWDLGEEWRRIAQIPFVYALWLVRPEVSDPREIAKELRARRDENLRNLDGVIGAVSAFTAEFCQYYYRECIQFAFGQREKEGLIAFQHLCEKHEILPPRILDLRLV
ncbi:MAG: menaquinone biosynthesis protein [Verrucomicrobiota bacterium]